MLIVVLLVCVCVCGICLDCYLFGFFKVCVSTGKTPASPYEYGSFGECLWEWVGLYNVFVWLLMNSHFSPPHLQLITAAQWVQRPLPTAPLQLTTTTDTWVWAGKQTHTSFLLFSLSHLMSLCRAACTRLLSEQLHSPHSISVSFAH